MMIRFRRNYLSPVGISMLLLLSVALYLACSDNLTNSKDRSVGDLNMTVSIAQSPELMEMVTSFRIIASGKGVVPDTFALAWDSGFLVGIIEAPAGDSIHFTAQALDERSTVIYEGNQFMSVTPDAENALFIDLYPIVQLIKLFPRYKRVAPGALDSVDVKVYNLDSLNQISFRLHSSPLPFYPDSTVVKVPAPADLIFFDMISDTTIPPFYALSFANTNNTQPMVDASGNVTLATIHFQAPAVEIPPDSTLITIDSLTIYDVAGNLMPSENVTRDEFRLVVAQPDVPPQTGRGPADESSVGTRLQVEGRVRP